MLLFLFTAFGGKHHHRHRHKHMAAAAAGGCNGPFPGYPECEPSLNWLLGPGKPCTRNYYRERGLTTCQRCSAQKYLNKYEHKCPPIAAPKICTGDVGGAYPNCKGALDWMASGHCHDSYYRNNGLKSCSKCDIQQWLSTAVGQRKCPSPGGGSAPAPRPQPVRPSPSPPSPSRPVPRPTPSSGCGVGVSSGCLGALNWMLQGNWNNPKFTMFGVDGTKCTCQRYLWLVEGKCKPPPGIPVNTYQNKKGLCMDPTNTHCSDIGTMGANWWYNWGYQPGKQCGGEYIPMIHSGKYIDKLSEIAGGSSDYILGFNEPNLPEQANMSPDYAARLWPRLEATGKKLVSPAMAMQPQHGGLTWLKRFVSSYKAQNGGRAPRMDAIAIHIYTANHLSVQGNIAKFEFAFPNIPIWVTEIGYVGRDKAAAVKFAKQSRAFLENDARVERWAWFMNRLSYGQWSSANLWLNSEVDPQGGRTELGNALM